MKNVPGVHLGIVINTVDPEKRGRVQVFVPNISTTLYEDWNKDAVDIKITSASFKPAVLERLKSLLPWAEVTSAFWGGSTSAPQNETTGKPAPSPSDSTANPENKNQSATPQKAPTQYPENNGANNPDGKFDGTTKQPQGAPANVTQTVVNSSGKNIAYDLNGSNRSNQLEGWAGNTVTSINVGGRPFNGETDVFIAGPGGLVGRTVSVYNPNTKKTITAVIADSYTEDPHTTTFRSNYAEMSLAAGNMLGLGGYQATGSSSTGTLMSTNDAVQITLLPADQYPVRKSFASIEDYNNYIGVSPEQNQANIAFAEGNYQKFLNKTKNPAYASQTGEGSKDQRVIRPTDLVNANGPVDVGGRAGAPMGAVSTPMVNSKVWVFFLNENPNFPICFASVSDAVTSVL